MNQLITTPEPRSQQEDFCTNCGIHLAIRSNFCGHCGSARAALNQPQTLTADQSAGHLANTNAIAISTNGQQFIHKVLNNRLAVMGIIALVGPLGLPTLWLSERFSPPTKIVTTIVYLLLTTVVPLALAWYWLDFSLRPLVDSFGK